MKDSIKMIIGLKESGETKDSIFRTLFESGLERSDIDKLFKESGIKFRRKSGSTWKDIMADSLIENPEIDYDSMITELKDSVKDPEYYVKGYLDIFRKMVQA